jgi:hypothetical protein
MRTDVSDVEKLAAAELFLCEIVGPVLKELIERAEDTYGVSIQELRINVERDGSKAGASGVNCTIRG